MLVNLKRNWFDPGSTLREVRFNPHDLPDTWEDILPKGAEVVDDKGKVVDHGSPTADPRRQIEESIRANPANAKLDDDEIKDLVDEQMEDKKAAAAAPAPSTQPPIGVSTTKAADAAKAKDPTTESNKK